MQDFLTSFDEFFELIEKEKDYNTVILCASKIDSQLFLIIQKKLVPLSNPRNDDLLIGDKPLSTFGSRIEITYRLGLIDDNFRKTLHLVRKLRNELAHGFDIKLRSQSTLDLVRSVVSDVKKSEFFNDFADHYFSDQKGIRTELKTGLILIIFKLEKILLITSEITLSDQYRPEKI